MSNGTGPVLVRFENLPPSPTDRHESLQLRPGSPVQAHHLLHFEAINPNTHPSMRQ
jgi:hypothetical protein